MSTLQRFLVVLAVLPGLVLPAVVWGNGWEWHSIPIDALVAGLDSEEPSERSYAIRAFGMRQDNTAVGRIIEISSSPEELTSVRREALAALGSIKDPVAVEPLIREISTGGSPELRGLAGVSLAKIGGDAALDALLAAFGEEQSLLARTDLVAALGHFVEPRAILALAQEERNSRSANLRRRAVIALGTTESPRATPFLVEALKRAENRSFIGDLVDALGRTGGAEALQPLTALLADSTDLNLRVRVIVALGAIREGGTSRALIKLLDDPRAPIRYHAIRALGARGDVDAGSALIKAYATIAAQQVSDQRGALFSLTMRYELIKALTAIAPVEAASIFRDAAVPMTYPRDSAMGLRLNEAAYQVRRAAIWGLGYSNDDRSVAFVLQNAIEDKDFRIRSVAVRSLGVLARPQAFPALKRALEDEVAEVRWQAALVLGRSGNVAAVSGLRQALKDNHSEVRLRSARALGYLNALAARPALTLVSKNDPSSKVRRAAQHSLSLLRD